MKRSKKTILKLYIQGIPFFLFMWVISFIWPFFIFGFIPIPYLIGAIFIFFLMISLLGFISTMISKWFWSIPRRSNIQWFFIHGILFFIIMFIIQLCVQVPVTWIFYVILSESLVVFVIGGLVSLIIVAPIHAYISKNISYFFKEGGNIFPDTHTIVKED